jgi:hypothetical protein
MVDTDALPRKEWPLIPTIVVVFIVAIQSFISLFVRGSFPIVLHPSLPFNATRAHFHHTVLASAPRYVDSLNYNRGADYIERAVLMRIRDGGRLSRAIDLGDLAYPSLTQMNHLERRIRNIIVRHDVPNSKLTPLVLSAHYDSHPNTPGAYDDCINIAILLEIAISLPADFPVPITFVFLGSEEHGLHGSRFLMNGSHRLTGSVLNLESMGSGRPFALVTTVGLSSSIVRAFGRVPGALLATFFNDISSNPKFTSFSDLTVYEENGLSGGQAIFFGNPTTYHTMYDRELSLDDVRYAGEIVTSFIENYDGDLQGTTAVGFGIAPFRVVLTKALLEQLAGGAAVIAIITGIIRSKTFIFLGILHMFAFFAVFAAIAAVLYCTNTFSYASHSLLFIALLKIFGVLLAVALPRDRERTAFFHLFLNGLLIFALRRLESSLIFMLATIPQLLSVLIANRPAKSVLFALHLLPTTYAFALLYPMLIGYMSQFRGFAAELVPLLAVALESLSIALALAPLLPRRRPRILPIAALGVFVTAALALKAPPFCTAFPIVGAESEFHFENGTSVAAFVPTAGARVLPALVTPGVEIVSDYQGYALPRGPAVVVRSDGSLPLEHSPVFTAAALAAGARRVHFDSGPIVDDTESVTLVLKCGSQKCVGGFDGFPPIRYRPTEFGQFTAIVRVTPVAQRLNLDFVVNASPVQVDVLYTSQAVAPNRARLRAALGERACAFAKERFLVDDVEFFSVTV